MDISRTAEHRRPAEVVAPQRHRQQKPVETNEQPKKEDTVEISEEGKNLSRKEVKSFLGFNLYDHPENNLALLALGDREELRGLTGAALFEEANRIFWEEGNMAPMLEKASQDNAVGEKDIFSTAAGLLWWKEKDKDVIYDIAKQLSSLFDIRGTDVDWAAKVNDREEGKKLMEDIANKYFSENPQMFMELMDMSVKRTEDRNLSTMLERFVYNSLEGKVENSFFIAKQLNNMLFNPNADASLETKAMDREAGKKLAEYIANNYLSGENAKAFVDEINKYADRSEAKDKGWIVSGDSLNGVCFKPKLFTEDKSVLAVIDKAKLSVKNMSIESLLAKYSISLTV